MVEREQRCYLCNEVCHIDIDLSTEFLERQDVESVACDNCLVYAITDDAIEEISSRLATLGTKKYNHENPFLIKLKHFVHKQWWDNVIPPVITKADVMDASHTHDPFLFPPEPNLLEQKDKFVFLLAEEISPGYTLIPKFEREGMQIGSYNQTQFITVLKNMDMERLILVDKSKSSWFERQISLSDEGWRYYNRLKDSGRFSKHAFMAMAFETKGLDDDVKKCFQDTVGKAGYKLIFADKLPKVGSVDDNIRKTIRTSAFVIADLSEGNQGAYFEAGFAHGVRKSVIYTCNKSTWDNPEARKEFIHFDVDHQTIIFWDSKELQAFEADLKQAIQDALKERERRHTT